MRRPWGSLSLASVVPWWVLAMAVTMASPRPDPGWFGGGAVEAVEDAGQQAGRDAGPVVADLDGDRAVVAGGGDGGNGADGGVGMHVG